ncbi:Calcineurin-like phosphoesterase [Nitrosospira sp. Nsp14]|uniref:metallophosphoesterase family protein n=1 Tax=Nitrosospira sp. Nsp14 TaxID=1855333 RepID=UPI0008EBA27C|nr:metallophosphoesterase [Nitrosospira sp. Nsp14]SFH53764.1 Calcineurin-like phosphoesterase [Nitrosospira sp. Nsp14]
MNLLILHLSDIHIKTARDEILTRGDLIGRATYKDLPMVDGVVILVTGDIAFSGKETEYALAEGFLEDVVKSIRREKNIPLKVLMCPGNHDCDFESGKPEIRELIIEKILKTSPDEITDTLIEQCVEVQHQFFAFQQKFYIEQPLNNHALWQSHRVTLNGHSVLFHLLNVAWMSKQREAQGTVVFPIKRFEAVVKTTSDATIVAFHHPLNWFAQSSYRPFRMFTRKAAHLILTGHEHSQAVAFIDEMAAGENVAIDGGVLQGANTQTSCFNLVLLNLETQEYSVEFQEWNGSLYVPKEVESAWSSFRRLPEKKRSEFSITDEFLELLNNAGARFTHYGKGEDLTLDDVYIYPEMRPLDEEEKGRTDVPPILMGFKTRI